jgi:hypothetical protein
MQRPPSRPLSSLHLSASRASEPDLAVTPCTRRLAEHLGERQSAVLAAEPERLAFEHVRRLRERDRLAALLEGHPIDGVSLGRSEVAFARTKRLELEHALSGSERTRLAVARLSRRNRLERLAGDGDLLSPFVQLAVGDVREHLAVKRDPVDALAVDHALTRHSRRARLERLSVFLPERDELCRRLLRLENVLVLDDAAEQRPRVHEPPIAVVPDLVLAVHTLPLPDLEVDQSPAPFAAQDDMKHGAVADGAKRTLEHGRAFTIPGLKERGREQRYRCDGQGNNGAAESPSATDAGVAQDRVPVAASLLHWLHPVQGVLQVLHGSASFRASRSAAWAAFSVAPTVPSLMSRVAAMAA